MNNTIKHTNFTAIKVTAAIDAAYCFFWGGKFASDSSALGAQIGINSTILLIVGIGLMLYSIAILAAIWRIQKVNSLLNINSLLITLNMIWMIGTSLLAYFGILSLYGVTLNTLVNIGIALIALIQFAVRIKN